MNISKHLTKAHAPDMQAKIDCTPAGMAHWAGTGPAGETCRRCLEMYDDEHPPKYEGGLITGRRCRKRSRLSGAGSNAMPASTPACIYFKLNEKAPAEISGREMKRRVKAAGAEA